MKFPRKLSRERLSVLSPEDRKIYEREHSANRNVYVQESVSKEDDFDFDKLLNEELTKIDESAEDYKIVVDNFINSFVMEEADLLLEDLINELDEEDIKSVKEEIKYILTESEEFSLDENENLILEGAEGYDAGEWIRGFLPKIGWLGKWIGGSLAALGLGCGYLWVIGKDRLAMAKLKKYMNRLVELTDQGVHKKKPWYSLFTWGETRKNLGEYNTGCFRTIQETADRNMCISVMVAAQKLGYFNTGDMMNISSGGFPQPGGGLASFKTNLADKIYELVES